MIYLQHTSCNSLNLIVIMTFTSILIYDAKTEAPNLVTSNLAKNNNNNNNEEETELDFKTGLIHCALTKGNNP